MNPANRIPAGLLQKRCASSISVQTSKERMQHAHMSIFKKVPSLFTDKVPHTDLFSDEARTRGPAVRDTRTAWKLLRKPAREPDLAERPKVTTTFMTMPLHYNVHEALHECGISVPSNIQQITIPAALSGKSVQISSATGTGKTVSFMVPIFQKMMEDVHQGVALRDKRPRAVILAPSFELVHQLWGVADKFAKKCGFRAIELYGPHQRAEREAAVGEMFDVLVTTPENFHRMLDFGQVVETDIKHVVFDEADLTVGGSYDPERHERDMETFFGIIKPILVKQFTRDSYLGRHKVQFYISSNNITDKLTNTVRNWIPHILPCMTYDLHISPRTLQHRFMPIAHENHFLALRGVLSTLGFHADFREMEKNERNKRNFWFPDAITFETGQYSPADQASWVTSRHGPGEGELPHPEQKRMLRKSLRQTYLKDYTSDAYVKEMLPAPASDLLLPNATPFSEISSTNPPKKSTSLIPTLHNSLVPVIKDGSTSANSLVIPVTSDPPPVIWGPVKTKAAPFTGLPGLGPVARPTKGVRTIIFVNKLKSLKRLARSLENEGYSFAVVAAHKGLFGHSARVAEFERWATGEVNLLLTTDVAARGIDHPLVCVINYECPRFSSDYLLRTGRAARMGRHGLVYNLVNPKNSMERRFMHRLERRLAKGETLEGLSVDKESFRRPVHVWWAKKKQKLSLDWSDAIKRGFINREEEKKIYNQTLRKAFKKIPNPADRLGRNKARPIPQRVLEDKQNALSWKHHMSSTHEKPSQIGNPLKLWRKRISGTLRGVAKNKDDPRYNALKAPVNRDKAAALKKKYGQYASPVPMNRVEPMKGARAPVTRYSSIPI